MTNMRKLIELINKNFFLSQLKFITPKDRDQEETPPLITISREMGAGGHPIGELVVKKLKPPWKLYHKNLIEKIAKKAHLKNRLVAEVDETKRPLIEEVIYDMFGEKYLNLNTYYKHLIRVLATIGKRGRAVIIGRGANFLFPKALNVRIICSMEQRIAWEMEFEKISRKEAIRRITQSDKDRYRFVKTLFGHSIKKPHHYHLTIRTGKELTIDDAADIIVAMAKKKFNL